ncbi:MAG: hypothetical protein JF590_04625 [Gemmatimonadetes bacterium]|nr:hypothetical protein [Gemmatimonadota bacterium]
MSSYARPDFAAIDDLESLLRHVGDELAAWRRRCLRAEQELAAFKEKGGVMQSPDTVLGRQRLAELEQENLALRARLDGASERVQMLVARLAFLERDVEEGAA